MFEVADSLAMVFAGLVVWGGGFLFIAYLVYRAFKRIGQHMDRVERELVMLNRQISELKDDHSDSVRAGR